MRNAVTFWTAPAAPRPRAIDDCWSPRFVSSFSETFLCFAFSGTETVPIRHAPLPRRARGGALGNVAGMTVAELPVALGSLNVRDTEGTKDGNAVTSANSSFESGDDENERGGAGVPMPMNESSSTRELSTADDRAPATEPKCYDTNAAVSSSASDSSSDETRLRAMHAAAALVHDDRLLEAKRLADQFFLFPPIAACSFYPTDPSPEDEQARSTLDSMLPAAERMVTRITGRVVRQTTRTTRKTWRTNNEPLQTPSPPTRLGRCKASTWAKGTFRFITGRTPRLGRS